MKHGVEIAGIVDRRLGFYMKKIELVSSWFQPVGRVKTERDVSGEDHDKFVAWEFADQNSRPGDLFRTVEDLNSGKFRRQANKTWETPYFGKLSYTLR